MSGEVLHGELSARIVKKRTKERRTYCVVEIKTNEPSVHIFNEIGPTVIEVGGKPLRRSETDKKLKISLKDRKERNPRNIDIECQPKDAIFVEAGMRKMRLNVK